MAARLQREITLASCLTFTDKPAQNAVNILKPLVPIPTQPHLHMVQHVADWVAPFPRSRHSPLPSLKFFHTPLHFPPLLPPSSSPLFFPTLRTQDLRAIIIINIESITESKIIQSEF